MAERNIVGVLRDELGNPVGLREFPAGDTIPRDSLPPLAAADVGADPAGTAAGLVSELELSTGQALAARYTKTEADALLGAKADDAEFDLFLQQTTSDLSDRYTKLEADSLLDGKLAIATFDQRAVAVDQALSERVLDTDARLSDSRAPTGPAGGVLSGAYPNPGFAVDMATQADLEAAVALRIAITSIVDDLNSVDANAPLSANQGRVLRVALDNINTVLTSDNFDLDTFQEIVDFIELNRETLDSLTTGSIAGLDAALADRYTKAQADLALAGKVDKVTGKQLSTEDYTAAEKGKLTNVATAATANATDAALRDRASHTGTQAISTVAGLQGQLDAINLLIGDTSAALDTINGVVV